jgi:MtrB/PioB family decaheme-associated outer membrane protein
MKRTPWLVLATVLGVDGVAADQSVTLNLSYSGADAAHFGEYTDLYEEGPYLVGALDLYGGLGSGNGRWRLDARNLGLGTYGAELGLAEQGGYELSLSFDGLRQFKRGDGRTPFRGNDSLVLPANWVAGPTTGALTMLGADLRRFDQRKERDILRFDAVYLFGPAWSVEAGFKQEDKTGTQVLGGAMFVDAARGNAALLPAPIDYTTQDFTSTLRYGTRRFNTSVAYLFTRFENDRSQLTWDNPFAGVVDARADFPNGRGALSLAPDYDRQQIRIDGSLVPLPGFDLQWDGAWASTRQDERFLPYTVNTDLVVNTTLPRNSLGGELVTRSGDLRVNYQPRVAALRKVTLRGGYHYDERDYDKPRDAYQYVRGDGADQPDAALAIVSTAHDSRREGFDVGADYRLPWWRGKLSLEYQYQDIARRNVAVDETETDTYRTVLRATPVPSLGTRLMWSFTDRKASTYDWAQSYFSRRTTDFINQVPDDQRFDNHPALRQFNLANAEIDAVELNVSYAGIAQWFFAADIEWRELNFDRSQFGLIRTESWRYGVDLQYTPVDALSAFGYASFTRYGSDAAGRSFGGGIEKPANRVVPPLPQGSDPARDWDVSTDDDVWTIGAGVTWHYSENLEFVARYTNVTTESGNEFTSGGSAFLVTRSLPDVETVLHDLSLNADYRVRADLRLSLQYRYYRYDEDDWAYDAVAPATLPNVLTLGERADNEVVNMIGISVRYDW